MESDQQDKFILLYNDVTEIIMKINLDVMRPLSSNTRYDISY